MPDRSSKSSTASLLRRVSTWKVFGIFCLAVFLILLGVLFTPWDAKPPEDADLQLKQPVLAADKNAFAYFETAGRMQVTEFTDAEGRGQDWFMLLLRTDLNGKSTWDPGLAEKVVLANAPMFAELEKGLACQACQPPLYDPATSPRWLQKQQPSVELLNLKSLHAQLSGDYLGAAKAGLQGLRLGQLTADNCNIMVGWLVGVSCECLALEQLENLVADAKTPEPVLREILATLNQWSPQGLASGLKQAQKGENRLLANQVAKTRYRPWSPLDRPVAGRLTWIPYVYKPNLVAHLFADSYRSQIANADLPWCRINFKDPGPTVYSESVWGKIVFYAKPNCLGNLLYLENASGISRPTAQKKCLLLADVAAMRLKTALRLYELQHGQLPDDLDALVPEYLPEIPRDPYDEQRFRYSKAKKMVWAVGCDLIDQKLEVVPVNIMVDRSRIHDPVMPLELRDPKSPPYGK